MRVKRVSMMIPVGLSSKSMFMKVPATSDYYEDLNN